MTTHPQLMEPLICTSNNSDGCLSVSCTWPGPLIGLQRSKRAQRYLTACPSKLRWACPWWCSCVNTLMHDDEMTTPICLCTPIPPWCIDNDAPCRGTITTQRWQGNTPDQCQHGTTTMTTRQVLKFPVPKVPFSFILSMDTFRTSVSVCTEVLR